MKDENQISGEAGSKPVVVHPGPLPVEDLLRYVDPAPDRETECFLAAIYADRREAPVIPPSK